ncbi:nuclear transport factor 2 family protein [Rheinheimera texasensis]|uniref:nuclear transport factor 2 family protein n=1 Tax=Rheinheimera texasensis TaxID=306205 RepID=UPI0032B27E38
MSLFIRTFSRRTGGVFAAARTVCAGIFFASIVSGSALAASTPTTQVPTEQATAAAARLAQQYVDATSGFDQALLQQILAADFQEISPVGEVDSREKVISFYPAAAKAKAPPVTATLSELNSQLYADQLVITTAKLTYTFDGTPHSRSMRVQFVSALQQGRWQLVSSQFTGIPAPKK